jgi:hypothetical protein
VASSRLPLTVTGWLVTTLLSAGARVTNVGAIVSMVKLLFSAFEVCPKVSVAETASAWSPCDNGAEGEYVASPAATVNSLPIAVPSSVALKDKPLK